MKQLRLVKPTIEHKTQYEEMMDEWENFGGRINPGAMRRYSKKLGRKVSYEHWLGWMEEDRKETQSLYFLMQGERILGAISLRYRSVGIDGHIGFGIRPSERKKGYATRMLELALPLMREYGQNPIIISCAKDNVGSAKTILKNGGTLIEEVNDEGELTQVYQIVLDEDAKLQKSSKAIKTIITDLDRTLLHTDKTISDYTQQVLKMCHEKGILIMAATARPERAILDYHGQVKFDAMTVMNGAGVIAPGLENAGYPIARESVATILERLCALPDIILSLECGNEVYANIEIPIWNAIVFHEFPKIPTEGPIYKILVSRENENIGPLVETLLTEDTYCTVANENLVQIMNKKATKWNGIRMMLEGFGITPEQAVYFGDDNDDIEALKNCGTGVAVANAIEAVKEAADVIVESNDEDGVAKWIERELPA
ncbi:MAG: GNAT family N-acetyltransferase [Lachnospiraceae bacterium]|nr:GNAT family N-acetyltransferase [Lachnospiraceae bacterium]